MSLYEDNKLFDIGEHLQASKNTNFDGRKTLQFSIRNKRNDLLGTVKWWSHWRCYVFESNNSGMIVLDASCMREIADFCEKIRNERE